LWAQGFHVVVLKTRDEISILCREEPKRKNVVFVLWSKNNFFSNFELNDGSRKLEGGTVFCFLSIRQSCENNG
jgi:hypothetical protein